MDIEIITFITEVFSVDLIHLLYKFIFVKVRIFRAQVIDTIFDVKVNVLPHHTLFGERIDVCAKPLQALRVLTDVESVASDEHVIVVDILAHESLSLTRRIGDEDLISMAEVKGLPEHCYGVLKYTGERILIRFGGDMYEIFPQYGGNLVENRAYANEQNAVLNLSVEQVAAMENGVIFGWDTPVANPKNYDENGHFYIPVEEPKDRRR